MDRHWVYVIVIVVAVVGAYFYFGSGILFGPGDSDNSVYFEEGKVLCKGTSKGYCKSDTHVCCGKGVCCPTENGGECRNSWGLVYCTATACEANGKNTCQGTGLAKDKKVCCEQNEVCGHGSNGVPFCGVRESPDLPECGVGNPVGEECVCWKDDDEPVWTICKPGEICAKFKTDDPQRACFPSEETCNEEGQFLCKGKLKFINVAECCESGQDCILDKSGFPRCQGKPGSGDDSPI